MKNFRFTDANGYWLNIYGVPGDNNPDIGGFVIDYIELCEGREEGDVAHIMGSTDVDEIDNDGNLV